MNHKLCKRLQAVLVKLLLCLRVILSFCLHKIKVADLGTTRGAMGHVLNTGIRCFGAIRVGISTAA